VDAILSVVRSGCSWRQLPVAFPPRQTVYSQFQQWEQRQVTERLLEEFRRSPKRWVVERSLAWLTAHRRLARDHERDPAVSSVYRLGATNAMIRRIARSQSGSGSSRQSVGTNPMYPLTGIKVRGSHVAPDTREEQFSLPDCNQTRRCHHRTAHRQQKRHRDIAAACRYEHRVHKGAHETRLGQPDDHP
jgi:transposase